MKRKAILSQMSSEKNGEEGQGRERTGEKGGKEESHFALGEGL